jgi:hypothetical protein
MRAISTFLEAAAVLPTDLAAAHAVILAQREMLTIARSEGKTVCPHVARWLALHCVSEGCSGRPSRSSPQEDEPWGILPIFS